MALVTMKKPHLGKANKTSELNSSKNGKNEPEQKSATDVSSESDDDLEEYKKQIEAEDESSDAVEEETASENNESNENEQEDGNAGWADSIAKVLNTTKPKTKKSVVLSRAKKLKSGNEKAAEKSKPDYGFEIEGEIKDEKPDKEVLKEQLKKRKNLPLSLRVRPSWKDMERERMLRKVATKGVVQLFNAVRIQQKDLQQQLDEAGPLDSRKDAVLNNINKRKFLDVLMSGNRAKSEAVDNKVKVEKTHQESSDEESDQDVESGHKRKSEWSVLRSDFMTNKKIKHWDEEDDESDKRQAESSEDSDDEE